MIRLERRHDVFHALGDARDRRDGERVSFLTNSPHIARRVEGSQRREDLDSDICEGLRQQVGDVDHTYALVHMASGTQVRPFDLMPQTLKRRSRRSEGGQIVQELNSIRDDAKGGWLDLVLFRKAREEEIQYVKKHAVYEKVPMSHCWKETGKNPIKTLGGHEQGNVRVSEHEISMGRKGIQHWTQARLVQRNITSGRSQARHLGGSVKQPEGNSALGD